MVLDGEAMLLRDRMLVPLDGVIHELLHLATLTAHDVVMMGTPVQLEDRLPALEMVALGEPGIHELRQHPVDRGQANLFPALEQGLVDILGGHVMPVGLLQHLQDLDPGEGYLQTRLLDIGIFHAALLSAHVFRAEIRYYRCHSTPAQNDNHLRMHKFLISTALLAGAVSLTGCSSVGDSLHSLGSVTEIIPRALDKAPLVYRPTIQQGNVVTQEQVNQLKPGMSRRQVRFILGSPTLLDAFHRDRWDYPFTKGVGSTPGEIRYLTVYFDNDRLVRITGDLHPQPADQQKPPEKPVVVKVPDWEPEKKSLLGRAMNSIGLGD